MAFSRSDQIASDLVDIARVRCFAQLVADRASDIFRGTNAPPPGPSVAGDEFLADVCHRVRTPLNGILGALELLLEADLSDDARELAAAAFQSARDLHRVFETELDAAVASS